MKIAIMMRAMDQDSGFRANIEGLVGHLLKRDQQNQYLLLYRTPKWFGRFKGYPNAKEILLGAPHKLLWDQVAVPYRAWKEGADIIFNPKFSVPLVSHCPVAMGLQEPAWWAWPDHYEWADVRYNRLMLPLSCRRAAHIFPMSQFILDENRKYLRLPLKHTTVTRSAPKPNFKHIEDAAALKAFRDKHGLPERYVLVVTRVDHPGLDHSSSFHPGKNPETALRAFIRLREQIPHTLVLAGRRVRDYMVHLGFTEPDFERVIFLGFVPHDEMPCLYSGAELFVLPSLYEGCPTTPMEAMACGAPIVASNVGGTPEIVADAALLADPNKPDEFAEKMLAVLEDPALQQELREKGFRRVAGFSYDTMASLVLQGLTEAIGRSKGH